MSLIRILLLLLVLAGLTLLLAQNWSPVLLLVFLGRRTVALPLAMWILLSLVAGVLTNALIASLFGLSNYFAAQQLLKRQRDVEPPQKASSQRRKVDDSASRQPSNTGSSSVSDWDAPVGDDWNLDEDVEKQSGFQDENKSATYERQQEPERKSQSGSVYSYSYQKPKSNAGQTESVYDAQYRVVTPPYQQTNTVKPQEDDWGFEDDEDENEDNSPMKRL